MTYDDGGQRLSGILWSSIVAKFALLAYLTVTAAVLTAGCSSGGSRAVVATRPADPQAEALVHSCAETTRNLASAHVVIAIKGKFGRLGPISHIEADMQGNPMMVNGRATYADGAMAPFAVADNTISIKMGNEWSEVGATSAFVPPALIDPRQGLRTILDSLTALQSAGTESVDGIPTRKVTGTVPARQLKSILPDASKPAEFTAWIRQGGDPVLVRTNIVVSADQSVTVSLSNWNVPVSLTPAPTT